MNIYRVKSSVKHAIDNFMMKTRSEVIVHGIMEKMRGSIGYLKKEGIALST